MFAIKSNFFLSIGQHCSHIPAFLPKFGYQTPFTKLWKFGKGRQMYVL